MGGFLHSVDDDINRIRNLLEDYQPGFALFKELVQNADDAGASRLDILFDVQITNAKHPLIHAPAIVVLNDGPFTSGDAKAIRKINTSEKANLSSAVGKYGLGLKSVFHLCEAFFYVGSGARGENKVQDLLNPWAGTGDTDDPQYNPEWEELATVGSSQIDAELTDYRSRLKYAEDSGFFGLWIPLRTRGSSEDFIMDVFPGDNPRPSETITSVLDEDALDDIPCLMPMLQNLSSIHIWNVGEFNFNAPYAEIKLNPKSTRPKWVLENGSGKLSGQVSTSGRSDGTYIFTGVESNREDAQLQQIRDSTAWPKRSQTIDNRLKAVDDKANSHAAAYFVHTTSEDEKAFSVFQSVFQPVNKIFEYEWDLIGSIRLMLHGYYLVNSSRTNIDFSESSTSNDVKSVTANWNRKLRDNHVLPSILKALEELYEQVEVPDIQQNFDIVVKGVLSFLKQEDFLELSTKRNQWVYRIDGSNSEWALLDAAQPLLELPEPSDINLKTLFPNLVNETGGFVVTSSGHPRISGNSPSPWASSILINISGINAGALGDPASTRYLTRFMIDRRKDYDAAPAAKLAIFRSLKKYLTTAPTDKLEADNSELRDLTTELNWPSIFGVPMSHDTEFASGLIREIAKAKVDAICLPESWVDNAPPNVHQINPDQVDELMELLYQILSRSNTKEQQKTITVTIEKLLALSGEDKVDIVNRHSSKKIFEAFDCTNSELRLFSSDELMKSFSDGMLFRDSSNSRGMADDLQCALSNSNVILASRQTIFSCLGENESLIGACNTERCINVLSSQPKLANTNDRVQLLRTLITDISRKNIAVTPPKTTILAIRYLVHGKQEYFNDLSPLLLWDSQSEDIWKKIAQVLTSADQDSWKIVEEDLGNELNSLQAEMFHIGPLGQRTVEAMLLSHDDLASLDFTHLEISERMVLINSLNHDLLPKLPIHETINGNLVSITDRCYMVASGEAFPDHDPLSNLITLIKQQPDSTVNFRLRDLVNQRSWTPLAAIEFALNSSEPSKHGQSIIAALKFLDKNSVITGPIREKIRSTAWLMTSNITPVEAGRLLYLEGANDLVSTITTLAQGEYLSSSDLDPIYTDEETIETLSLHVLDTPSEMMTTIGLILEDLPDFTIGISAAPKTYPELTYWLEVFEQVSNETMKSRQLLDKLTKLEDNDLPSAILEQLIPALSKRPAWPRLVQILDYLSEVHRNVPSLARVSREIHKDYLRDATTHPEFIEKILPRIQLPNATGQLKNPASLCAESVNIDPRDCLDKQYEKILQNYLPSRSTTSTIQQRAEQLDSRSTTELIDYLQEWADYTSPELVGAFLAILGKDPSIEQAAKFHLERSGYELDNIRGRFGWTPDPSTNRDGWLAELNGADVIGSTTFNLTLSSGEIGETVSIPNLLGTLFDARVGDIREHLGVTEGIVLPLLSLGINDERIVRITIAKKSPDQFGARAKDVLESTMLFIWEKAYRQTGISEDLWDAIGEEDQLHVSTIQSVIAETILDRIKQYRQVNNHSANTLKISWDELRYQKTQSLSDGTTNIGKKLEKIEAEKVRIIENLKNLLKDDVTFQNDMLRSTRQTVEDANYLPSVILFELFQNADDAVAELRSIGGEPNDPSFVVSSSEDEVTVVHWGRQLTRQSGPTGNHLRFKTDLEKMLVMYASDKSSDESENKTTGKFGLGFKSVFLASDVPLVVSERIGFKVVGGVYPESLTTSERRTLKQKIQGSRHSDLGATFINLPLDQANKEDVVARFRELRSVLHVFAKEIRQIELDDEISSWNPKILTNDPCLEFGTINVLNEKYDLIVVRSTNGSSVALPIKDSRFTKLPQEVPTIWVTAPTVEKSTIGFLINGDFAIDPGRANILAGSGKNTFALEGLSTQILHSLGALTSDLELGRDEFGLELGTGTDKEYKFWASFWDLLIPLRNNNDETKDKDFARKLFWDGDSGAMATLLKHKRILPTCLDGEYLSLTKFHEVKYVLSGTAEHPSMFPNLSKLEVFQSNFEPGSIVSESKVSTPLKELGCPLVEVTSVSLIDVIKTSLPKEQVDPNTAHALGEMLNHEVLDEISKHNSKYDGEFRELWDYCETALEFQAEDGSWSAANNLLITEKRKADNPDEHLRAGFAPGSKVISNAYSQSGIEFFKSVRKRLDTPLETLAEWARNAKPSQQQSVFQYIAEGELSRPLGQLLNQSKNPDWLTPSKFSETSDALSVLDQYNQEIVKSILGGGSNNQLTSDDPEAYSDHPISPHDPQKVLNDVWDWWSSVRDHELSKFDKKTYPDGRPLSLTSDISIISTDARARKNWLELFTLGATHTLGRVTPEQNAGFITLARDKGWFDRVAEPKVNTSVWGDIMGEFFNSRSDRQLYHYWFGLLASIYQFSNWLDDYAQGFLSLDKRGRVSLYTILHPRSDPGLAGTGLDAPSIERALGYGASFVVRELVRTGALISSEATVHAYVAKKSTVDFLTSIGLDIGDLENHEKSKRISDFLSAHLGEKSNFLGDFDIPLQVASENDFNFLDYFDIPQQVSEKNRSLWSRLLGN